MPRWTKEQEQAINESGHNIIVSAGAGSGKTAVLSERVITNLKRGMHISQMLILTFTRAAASEMRERIRKKIISDDSLRDEVDYIDSAYITTFDSFALSVVKKYHYVLNLSKNISIVPSFVIDIKKREILDEIIDGYYNDSDERFLRLISDFCVKDDKEIRNSIMNISSKLDMRSDKREYLLNYVSVNYQSDKIDRDILEYVDLVRMKVLEIEGLLKEISVLVDGDYYDKLCLSLDGLVNAFDYDEIVSNLKGVSMPNAPRGCGDEVKRVKSEISGVIKELKGLCSYSCVSEIRDSILKTRDYVSVICDIIVKFSDEVYKYKELKNVFEFNDIAILAIRIVKENSNIRDEIRDSFREIMIDEYQDTSDLQEEFISYISCDNVYMVGDIKQSIYRFRNANPRIFKDKYDAYSKHMGGEKIDLNKNFRSREEVINNINVIFDMIMDYDIGGADYRGDHRMVFGNLLYRDNSLLSQDNNMEIFYYDDDGEFSREEIEAFVVFNDIRNKVLHKYKVFDKDDNVFRDVRYSDFAILMDRTGSFDLYKKISQYLQIPLMLYKDNNMSNDDDIMVICNLVNLIIMIRNREEDVRFRYLFTSVARSFLFRLDDEEIFDIFCDNGFRDSLIYKKCLDISYKLDSISNRDFILEIIDGFDYYNKLITIGNIEENMIKIDKILDMADSLSDLGCGTLAFGKYFDEIVRNDYDIKYSVNDFDADAVKIMTIHKSKGLEYPICYYTGLYKSFNVSDIKERFLYDRKYGIITPYFDEGVSFGIYKNLLKEDYLREEVSEKIRLFYVAMTRAREKMIVVVPRRDKDFGSVSDGGVSFGVRIKYRSFLDILDSIRDRLSIYSKVVNLEGCNISRDYDLVSEVNYGELIGKSDDVVDVNEINIGSLVIQSKSYSKNEDKLIDKRNRDNMDLGLKIHQVLEYAFDGGVVDFSDKEIIDNFLNQDIMKNVRDARVFSEYEFVYEDDNVRYHGIIDLMCVYDNYIDIIDYKLKNVRDKDYMKQLNGYRDYIRGVSNKEVNIYLYSILDNKIFSLD